MTLEAMLTHAIDDLDSRVNSWLNIMGGEGGTRRWSDSSNFYGQHIWRGTLPTLQVEKKGPPPEMLTPVIYVPREGPASGARPGPKRPKRGGEHRPPRPRPASEAGVPGEGATVAEAGKAEAAAAAPPERPEQPERPARPERPDRGPRGGPGDRQKRYMGPRLPGDKGPQPRPKQKESALTHNPFAALAQKIEGVKEGKPAEPAPAEPAPAEASPPEAAEPAASAEPAAPPAPEGDAEQGSRST
jgi:3'-5' exoribonuclease